MNSIPPILKSCPKRQSNSLRPYAVSSIDFLYKCSRCKSEYILSDKEVQQKDFIFECGCGNVIKIDTLLTIQVKFGIENQTTLNAIQILCWCGYTTKEAKGAIRQAILTNWQTKAELVKTALLCIVQ